eukprot:765641-Pleurochrysis_carterae.AAC.3
MAFDDIHGHEAPLHLRRSLAPRIHDNVWFMPGSMWIPIYGWSYTDRPIVHWRLQRGHNI